jgi:hypothetical protein
MGLRITGLSVRTRRERAQQGKRSGNHNQARLGEPDSSRPKRVSTERQGWPGTRWQQSSIVTTKTGDDGRLAFKIALRLVLRRAGKVALSETEKPVTLFPNWS